MLDFLCIGAQKAGTTWLYEKLRLHPEIGFPGGKEVHFWDKANIQRLSRYRGLFASDSNGGKKLGEITPAYATLQRSTIRSCHDEYPDARLIYILRNPIDRAWSSAKMALSRADMQIGEASDQWLLDHFRSKGSMLRGDYEKCLRNWLSHYPRQQMLACFFDELTSEPENLLRRCFRHIGVSEDRYDWSVELRKKVFATEDYPLPVHLREELVRIYQPKIRSLSEYLEVDLTSWL